MDFARRNSRGNASHRLESNGENFLRSLAKTLIEQSQVVQTFGSRPEMELSPFDDETSFLTIKIIKMTSAALS